MYFNFYADARDGPRRQAGQHPAKESDRSGGGATNQGRNESIGNSRVNGATFKLAASRRLEHAEVGSREFPFEEPNVLLSIGALIRGEPCRRPAVLHQAFVAGSPPTPSILCSCNQSQSRPFA